MRRFFRFSRIASSADGGAPVVLKELEEEKESMSGVKVILVVPTQATALLSRYLQKREIIQLSMQEL